MNSFSNQTEPKKAMALTRKQTKRRPLEDPEGEPAARFRRVEPISECLLAIVDVQWGFVLPEILLDMALSYITAVQLMIMETALVSKNWCWVSMKWYRAQRSFGYPKRYCWKKRGRDLIFKFAPTQLPMKIEAKCPQFEDFIKNARCLDCRKKLLITFGPLVCPKASYHKVREEVHHGFFPEMVDPNFPYVMREPPLTSDYSEYWASQFGVDHEGWA